MNNIADYSYCYLEYVLVDSLNNTKALSFILATDDLHSFGHLITDMKGLLDLLSQANLVRDFSLEGKLLKAEDVPRLLITQEDIAVLNTITEYKVSTGTFMDFLACGVENKFLIISDDKKDLLEYKGADLVSFTQIKVAQTTMSIYAPVYCENTLHNKMLLTMEDSLPVLHEFLFAAPIDCDLSAYESDVIALHEIKINNEPYRMYSFSNMKLYAEHFLKSLAMLNKIQTMRCRYERYLTVLKQFQLTIMEMAGYNLETPKMEWAGWDRSYKDSYGVFFKSSLPSYSKRDAIDFVNQFTELIMQSLDKEVPDRYVQEEIGKLKDDKKKSFSLMASIMSIGDNSSMLLQCKQLITKLEENILHYDLLLYKTRISSYATSTRLVSSLLPLFRGSDEKAFTEVTTKFNYGGVQ